MAAPRLFGAAVGVPQPSSMFALSPTEEKGPPVPDIALAAAALAARAAAAHAAVLLSSAGAADGPEEARVRKVSARQAGVKRNCWGSIESGLGVLRGWGRKAIWAGGSNRSKPRFPKPKRSRP